MRRVGQTFYVYPRGEVVYLYGPVEYERRLAGHADEASPYVCEYVTPFKEYEDFVVWCRSSTINA